MGRSMPKFSSFSPPYSGEEKMLLQLDIAGKVVYLLTLIVLLLLYFQKWKRNRVNVVHGDNGGETIRGRIARRVRAGGQYAEEVRFDVASDEPDENITVGGTINGETIRGRIAGRVHAGGQYAEEVRFDVASDEPDENIAVGGTINGETIRGRTADGGTINGETAMDRTAIAATMPFEFN